MQQDKFGGPLVLYINRKNSNICFLGNKKMVTHCFYDLEKLNYKAISRFDLTAQLTCLTPKRDNFLI